MMNLVIPIVNEYIIAILKYSTFFHNGSSVIYEKFWLRTELVRTSLIFAIEVLRDRLFVELCSVALIA